MCKKCAVGESDLPEHVHLCLLRHQTPVQKGQKNVQKGKSAEKHREMTGQV